MEWLIGIGRNKLGGGTSSSSRTPRNHDENQKAYMNDTNLGNLVSKITKDELQETVPVPVGIDINEWLATHTLSFFNHISLIFDSLNDICTPQNCVTVSAGSPIHFTWIDERGKKVRLSAPQYIELVVVQIQKYVTDETIFPTKYDMTFPSNFQTIVKKIFRLLFHVLVHVYQSHYEHIAEMQQLSTLNTIFIHFMYFQTEHGLLDSKEILPLEDLVKSLCL